MNNKKINCSTVVNIFISIFSISLIFVCSSKAHAEVSFTPQLQINNMPEKIYVGDSGQFDYQIKDIYGIPATGEITFYPNAIGKGFSLRDDGTWYAKFSGEYSIHAGIELSEETRQTLTNTFGSWSVNDNSLDVPVRVFPSPEKVFRLYNLNTGEHFFTKDLNEQNGLISSGWENEGASWKSYSADNGYPIYRIYNQNAGDHHYTKSQDEVNYLISKGWENEGISFYSSNTNHINVYRLYNPNAQSGAHHYTTSEDERNGLIENGWVDEGVSWYEE